MAKTLTIAGVDFAPQRVNNSAQIRELVQNKSNVMHIQITQKGAETGPTEGAEIVFKDGSRFLFAGFISKVTNEEVGKGAMFIYDVEASDYSYIFNNKVARRAYSNETLSAIVNDLMDTYVDASYGFDTTNVATGPVIDTITFDHVSIRKCFEKLQKLTGYSWFVDYEKKLYFQTGLADPAPETITDAGTNTESIQIDYDTSQVRNAVIVIGSPDGQQSASTTTETFTGDGDTRSWELQDKPSQIVSIKVNGVTKQFSLDVNERESDNYIYSFSGASVAQTVNETTLTGGDTLEVIYYARIPIIVEQTDPLSIATFAALDGGDGKYEYTIKESSITSKAEANTRALQELSQFARPLVTGTFKTRTSILSGGSIFSVGQYVTVNLPTYGISTDAAFLIQEVNITMDETTSGGTEYHYTVRFGGKLAGVREFLESLASEQGGEVTDVDLILTLEQLEETAILDDDAPSMSKVTPPFVWAGSGSPQAEWSLSEYA